MHIINTLRRIVSEFGWLGWIELIAASLVAIGCGGELWVLLNKLTRHIEPLPKRTGACWKVIAWIDVTIRPFVVRLKINGRKLSEAKEQLLERSFVMLVALGVVIEFVCLIFSLHEVANLNEKAGQASKDAAESRRVAANTESNNLVLEQQIIDLKREKEPIASMQASLRFELSTMDRKTGDIGLIVPEIRSQLAGQMWIYTTNRQQEEFFLVSDKPLHLDQEHSSAQVKLIQRFQTETPNLFGSFPEKQVGVIDSISSVFVRLYWEMIRPGSTNTISQLTSGTFTIVANTKSRTFAIPARPIDFLDARINFVVTNNTLIPAPAL
jgi:hypothetical protein